MHDGLRPGDRGAAGPLRTALLGGGVGVALALVSLSPGFILGTGPFWDWPANDFNSYLVAWNYFLHQPWHLPLFDLPDMGYPEGGSVLFNDALPAGVLASKVALSLTGTTVNPFGLWILITYVLLGLMSARLLRLLGVTRDWALVAGAFLAITRMFFMWRFGHTAISSHFLVVWALCVYVKDDTSGRFAWGEHLGLAVAAMLINPYLVVMAAVVQGASVLTLAWRRRLSAGDLTRATAVVGAVIVVGLIEGYGAVLGGSASMRGGGFGVFSWNPVSAVVPPPQLWGDLGVVRDATGGQYEGDSYLGAGVLVVLLAALTRPRVVWRVLARHGILVSACLVCTIFALSNRVHVGSRLVLEVELPTAAAAAASLFRASGRFIWVPAYAATLGALALVVNRMPRVARLLVILLAVTLQLMEARVLVNLRGTGVAGKATFDTARMGDWMAQHRRVFQFPSYTCGGLTPGMRFGGPEANRELHIQLIASRLGTPINGVYTSRQLKDCGAERAWADQPLIEPDVLYLFSPTVASTYPALKAWLASAACRDVGYVVACSSRF